MSAHMPHVKTHEADLPHVKIHQADIQDVNTLTDMKRDYAYRLGATCATDMKRDTNPYPYRYTSLALYMSRFHVSRFHTCPVLQCLAREIALHDSMPHCTHCTHIMPSRDAKLQVDRHRHMAHVTIGIGIWLMYMAESIGIWLMSRIWHTCGIGKRHEGCGIGTCGIGKRHEADTPHVKDTAHVKRPFHATCREK